MGPLSLTIRSGGSANDKFFNYTLAEKMGVAVPPTVILPLKRFPEGTNEHSISNLEFPLGWDAVFAHVGEHGFLKPVNGGDRGKCITSITAMNSSTPMTRPDPPACAGVDA